MNISSTLFFIAGGSGGHILPLLSRCSFYETEYTPLLFFTSSKEVDAHSLKDEHAIAHTYYFRYMKKPQSKLLYPLLGFYFLHLFFSSLWYFLYYRPSRVVTSGGMFSIPFCYVASLFDIPIDLYEFNAVPGKAASMIAYWAERIFVTFNESKNYFPEARVQHMDYPLRFEEVHKMHDKHKIVQRLNEELISHNALPFFLKKKTLFVIGGSQGSAYLNELIKAWSGITKTIQHFQIIHQVGFKENIEEWKAFYEALQIPALVFSFRPDVDYFYTIADIVISRAGAGVLFEIEFFEKKAIIIPIEVYSTSHQYDNARIIAERNPLNIRVHHQGPFEEAAFLLDADIDDLLKNETLALPVELSTTYDIIEKNT